MQKLFYYADEHIKQCDWTDFALLKLCMFALGLLFGSRLCDKTKGFWRFLATILFFVTFIPQMFKFLLTVHVCKETERRHNEVFR